MKFGKVADIKGIDLSLPDDHVKTAEVLTSKNANQNTGIYVGCAKWNRQDLKNFYPRGTKDELAYYSSQFNCIEMNASFYRIFSPVQFEKWRKKVPQDFKFFPKVFQGISHWKRLTDADRYVTEFVHSIEHLNEKLGITFLQMHENFAPKEENKAALQQFLEKWSKYIPLALELRHTNWDNHPETEAWLGNLLQKHQTNHVITDTAGRRDLLHMRLTTKTAFIRYVGANHPSDYIRAEEWVIRLKKWKEAGLEQICFFVHQHNEIESVNISRHFINLLNKNLGSNLKMPQLADSKENLLF